uniref:Biogenesis of lysosome-related organelles complex 1 subunit 5 n=1 Tax=Bos indicus x Bos taurus TaxID=30522 RepID=A0A4W2IDK3_BOBOX
MAAAAELMLLEKSLGLSKGNKYSAQGERQDLNSYLEDKVYLTGYNFTLADILLYYGLHRFIEKRGLREMRVLENLKNMIHETNEHTLPTCRATMQDSLNQVLQRLQAATDSVRRLQQREQERKKIHNDLLIASEKQHVTQWEDFMKEQHSKQAEVDEEHRKAMEKLREQYAEMEKGLAKFSAF